MSRLDYLITQKISHNFVSGISLWRQRIFPHSPARMLRRGVGSLFLQGSGGGTGVRFSGLVGASGTRSEGLFENRLVLALATVSVCKGFHQIKKVTSAPVREEPWRCMPRSRILKPGLDPGEPVVEAGGQGGRVPGRVRCVFLC